MCSKVNHLYEFEYIYPLGFPDGPVVKILPANAGDSRDVGLVPGLGRSPGVKMATSRLRCPWDSPDKNTGVGCHFLLQCRKVKSESEVAQSCSTQRPHWLQPTRLRCPWDSPGKSTGVDCCAILQGIFPTQGLNPCLMSPVFPVFLPGKFHGQRSLVGYNPCSCRVRHNLVPMSVHTHTIFYCIYLPHPLYPCLLWWTFNFIPCPGFLPCPRYCK